MLAAPEEPPAPNWWILGGSLVFVVFTLAMGFSRLPWNQEIIFAGSMAIIVFLIAKLTRELEPAARATLIGTAIVIFVYRAVPSAGRRAHLVDDRRAEVRRALPLGAVADQQRAHARRDVHLPPLHGGALDRLRRGLSDRREHGVLSLPIVGLYYGLHHWTAAATGGVVDAHFIVLVNTALESPARTDRDDPHARVDRQLGARPISRPPISRSWPRSPTSRSPPSQLGTKYLNEIFVDHARGAGRGERSDQGARRLQPAGRAPDRPAASSPWRCRSARYCSCGRCG